METQVTIADLERQLGQMVVQLMTANKIIEAQAAKIADLTKKESDDGTERVPDAVGDAAA